MCAEYNNNQCTSGFNEMIHRAKLYTKRMSKSCTWGGEIELQMLGPIVHSLGFKGIKVYNAENKKHLMSSPMTSHEKTVLHIVLSGVRKTGGGGVHFDFWNKPQKKNSESTNISKK